LAGATYSYYCKFLQICVANSGNTKEFVLDMTALYTKSGKREKECFGTVFKVMPYIGVEGCI
jgi:hypothetical protein